MARAATSHNLAGPCYIWTRQAHRVAGHTSSTLMLLFALVSKKRDAQLFGQGLAAAEGHRALVPVHVAIVADQDLCTVGRSA